MSLIPLDVTLTTLEAAELAADVWESHCITSQKELAAVIVTLTAVKQSGDVTNEDALVALILKIVLAIYEASGRKLQHRLTPLNDENRSWRVELIVIEPARGKE